MTGFVIKENEVREASYCSIAKERRKVRVLSDVHVDDVIVEKIIQNIFLDKNFRLFVTKI